MYESFLLAGFGGQGVMFAGQLLAYAGMDAGLDVTWIPSYGPEMRGGTAHCAVIISDKPIGSPLVRYPQTVLAFNNPSFDKYEPQVAVGGILAYNASIIGYKPSRTDITYLPVPASELADQLENPRLMNMVMLGALLSLKPVLSLDQLKGALNNHIPAHRRSLLEVNYAAVDKGSAFEQEIRI